MKRYQHESRLSAPTVTPERLAATCLFVIAVIMVGMALAYTRAIMIPFAVAIFMALVLAPIVRYMQDRMRLPRMIPVVIVLAGTVLTLYIFALFVSTTVLEAFYDIDTYRARLTAAMEMGIGWLALMGIELDRNQVIGYVRNLPVLTFVQDLTGRAAHLFSNVLLVLIFVFFILSGQRSQPDAPIGGLFVAIDSQLRRYLFTKLMTSTLTGLLVWAVLASMGVDLALMFGIFTFILNFIPTIGSIIATLLPLPIVLLQFDSVLPILLALGIPAIIQFTVGTVIEPKVLGRSLDLHPVTILMSLMFWGLIWGVVGMFLGVPIMAAIKLILERFEGTKMIADLMSGRTPYTPY